MKSFDGTRLALFPGSSRTMTIPPELPHVLVIDDEIGPRESLRMLLKPNYQVHTATTVEAGLRLLREKHPDAVVSDIRMPGTNGIDGLRRIREIDPHVAVIMLTGFGALETAQEALRLGANDYISKPFDAHEMREVISRNVERTRVQRSGVNAAAEIRELNNRLLKELAQKERLASLGQASAEFVHDLGNPLTIVWGYVQLLAKKLEQSEKEKGVENPASAKELKIIEQNVRLCRELLTMWQSYGSVEAAPHRPVASGENRAGNFEGRGIDRRAKRRGVAERGRGRRHCAGRPRANQARHPECDRQRRPGFRGTQRLGHGQLHLRRILRRRAGAGYGAGDRAGADCRRFSNRISPLARAAAALAWGSTSPRKWWRITTARSRWRARPMWAPRSHPAAASDGRAHAGARVLVCHLPRVTVCSPGAGTIRDCTHLSHPDGGRAIRCA